MSGQDGVCSGALATKRKRTDVRSLAASLEGIPDDLFDEVLTFLSATQIRDLATVSSTLRTKVAHSVCVWLPEGALFDELWDLDDCSLLRERNVFLVNAAKFLEGHLEFNVAPQDTISPAIAIQSLSALSMVTMIDFRDWLAQPSVSLEPLTKLRRLASLSLAGWSALAHDDFLPVTNITTLTALNLHRCASFSKKTIAVIVAKLVNLTDLDLSFGIKLADDVVKQIAKLKLLVSLNLSGHDPYTSSLRENSLHHLAPLVQLRVLRLNFCCAVKDLGITHVVTHRQIQDLDLCRTSIFDPSVALIAAEMPNLTSLNLKDCFNLTPAAIGHLTKLPNLTTLGVCTSDEIFAELVRLRSVSTLLLSRNGSAAAASFGSLEALPLTSLDVSECTWFNDDMADSIPRAERLTHLNVQKCAALSNIGLRKLTRCTSLRTVNLKWCEWVNDESITILSTWRSIRKVSISRTSALLDGSSWKTYGFLSL